MWKRIAVGVAIVAVGVVGWKLVRPMFRSEATKRLMAHHSQVRERIGDGLDKLFDQQVDAGDNRIELHGKFDFASELKTYDGGGCAAGFSAAFEDALGADAVKVESPSFDTRKNPRLEITAKMTWGGTEFQLANSKESYQSVAMSADVDLAGLQVHVDAKPPAKLGVKYTRYSFSFDRAGATSDEIQKAIVAGTCQEAGYALLEALTTWKRPAPPAAPDPVEACTQGFHCREAGDALAKSNPVKAAAMYAHACSSSKDDEACLKAAALVAPDADHGETRVHVEMACHGSRGAPCFAAGQIAMIPRRAGTKPDSRHALGYFLRACDRGIAEACARVEPLLKETPFAEAAHLPVSKRAVASKRFGTIFALRWGQWTDMDSGQPTAWVTKRPQPPAPEMLVTEFTRATLPKGIVAPAGVETVYAVALEGGSGKKCIQCSPDGGTHFAATTCICALVPR